MPPSPPPAPKTRNVICPECDKEVVLTLTDDGNYEGDCSNCHLDVGKIYTKRRYQTAEAKIAEREEEEKGKKKKKSSPDSW